MLSILLPVCLSCLFFIISHLTSTALAIVAEHSFWLSDHTFPSGPKQAAKSYMKSSAAISVSQHIQAVFGANISDLHSLGQMDSSLYQSQIALPLSGIIINNLLGMLSVTSYNS